jgi:hypothetical protein
MLLPVRAANWRKQPRLAIEPPSDHEEIRKYAHLRHIAGAIRRKPMRQIALDQGKSCFPPPSCDTSWINMPVAETPAPAGDRA